MLRKFVLTGKKLQNKMYYRHSMYSGRFESRLRLQEMINKKPERMIWNWLIYGMLPKNRLGDKMKLKLKVYAGAEHPHQAQNPEVYELRG